MNNSRWNGKKPRFTSFLWLLLLWQPSDSSVWCLGWWHLTKVGYSIWHPYVLTNSRDRCRSWWSCRWGDVSQKNYPHVHLEARHSLPDPFLFLPFKSPPLPLSSIFFTSSFSYTSTFLSISTVFFTPSTSTTSWHSACQSLWNPGASLLHRFHSFIITITPFCSSSSPLLLLPPLLVPCKSKVGIDVSVWCLIDVLSYVASLEPTCPLELVVSLLLMSFLIWKHRH